MQAANHGIVQTALADDAHIVAIAVEKLVHAVVADELDGRRETLFDLHFFLQVGRRRKGDPVQIVGRFRDRIVHGEFGFLVVLGREPARHMAGPDAELHHHRRITGFREFEGFFNKIHDPRMIDPGVDQPHGALHRKRVAAFLDDRGAFAVVFSENDQRAADHADGRDVGQGVRRDVGPDRRFPGYRATDGIVDRGCEHGAGSGFIGADLCVDAEFCHQAL